MTPAQSKLYKSAVESMRREVAAATTVVTSAKPRGRPKKVQSSGAATAGPETSLLVAKLGSQRVNNIFTHLRKVAQHPLLVRNIYTDAQVHDSAYCSCTLCY
jgi:SWI/SNF-related matrix-associated actin-dependent regulator 1 of chromatin subfamily A